MVVDVAKCIATYERPRYAIEAWNVGYSKWEQVGTDGSEFSAKTRAEKYAKTKDARVRVMDRGEQ